MMKDPAKWYNAVVRDCGLSAKTFQLAQGSIVLGTDSTALWSILDSIPPESFENYNPAQGNLFSENYGAIIGSLKDDDPLVTQAVQTWNAAGGFESLKAFDKTIVDLKAQLTGAPGAKIEMDVDNQSAELGNAWTKSDSGRPTQLFRSLPELGVGGGPVIATPPAGSVVEVRFARLLTFAAGPLAKFNTLNPNLSDYKPWYNSAALKLALEDQGAWKSPDRWAVYFNSQQGSMLRCCTSLVVVDGVTTVTKPARRNTAGAFSAAFWPFSIPPRGVSRPQMTGLDEGSVVIESPQGNPLILGVNVMALSEFLGAASARAAVITVRNQGWFYARFSVMYKQNTKPVFIQSESFDRGTSRIIQVPGDATDILLRIEEQYSVLPEKWTTVLASSFVTPLDKSYEVSGTTLHPVVQDLKV